MKIAITGTLSSPRKEVIELIETRTNGRFSPEVTYDTNYLVAARFDTAKARKAAQIGVAVISEEELLHFIELGSFPPSKLTDCPRVGSNFPEIDWNEVLEKEEICFLEYESRDGEKSERYVVVTARGLGSNGEKYLGAYDGGTFKTFRVDRILKLQAL